VEFAFKLRPVELGVDDEGDQITTCVVDALGSGESSGEEQAHRDGRDQICLLREIAKHPGLSESAYASAINRHKSFVHRSLARLLKDKLITMTLDKPRVTKKGKEEIKQYEDDLDNGPM
jgi:hypothetical protein